MNKQTKGVLEQMFSCHKKGKNSKWKKYKENHETLMKNILLLTNARRLIGTASVNSSREKQISP